MSVSHYDWYLNNDNSPLPDLNLLNYPCWDDLELEKKKSLSKQFGLICWTYKTCECQTGIDEEDSDCQLRYFFEKGFIVGCTKTNDKDYDSFSCYNVWTAGLLENHNHPDFQISCPSIPIFTANEILEILYESIVEDKDEFHANDSVVLEIDDETLSITFVHASWLRKGDQKVNGLRVIICDRNKVLDKEIMEREYAIQFENLYI